MVDIITLANQLNKDYDYIKQLCYNCEIPIHADKEGEFISNEDAQLFINKETKTPNRYNKRGMECVDIIQILGGQDSIQSYYLGCIVKYLYRRLNIGDLRKAREYLDMWIKEVEKGNKVVR
nr:MAG TPA: nucelotide kinase [Caudoviricetes sp.]